jgi:hypothetical protein
MTPWITKPVPFNIGQGAAAAATSEPMAWIASGYSGSEPTISTTNETNDTTQPNGDDAGSGFISGNALSVEKGNLKIKIVAVGDAWGDYGSLSNTVIGLTTIETAGNISDVEMGIAQSYVVANIMFNNAAKARPNEQSGSEVTVASGDILEIRRDGTTLTWHLNDGSAFYTVTGATAEDYQVYNSSDDGDEGKFIHM